MSEQKRVPTQSLELSGSLVNSTKKEKKGEKGKQLAPSFRFELSLDDKNDGYSEFNYAQLLKVAEKKRGKEQKSPEENVVNGLDPFDEDDDDKLKEMAKRFEAKYGTTTAEKNRKKYDDDVDLGAGYDENDSFIDNTDAYDEVVPEGVTTAYGGFYINSGPLEFSVKPEEQNSLAHRNNINNDDNSSESSEDEVEDSNSPDPKRRRRLMITSSEDEDVDDIVTEPVVKKVKLDENGEKKTNDDIMKKKKKIIGDQQNLDNSNRQKNFDDKRDNNVEVDLILDCQDERKKLNCDAGKVKLKKVEVRKLVKDVTINGNDEKKIIDAKKLLGKDSNIDDAIESVVNDGRIDDESSRDTIDSGKSRCIAGTSSECEDADKMDIRLPENLPDNIRDIINKLKKAAERNKEGKIKFFDASVNSTLFSLEKKLRILDSSTVRSQVYAHLAHFLSCSKVTLANRAKKLCLQDTEGRVKEPIQRLKAVIDEMMPTVMDKYNEECQRVIVEKGVEASLSDRDSSDGNERPVEKSKIPQKRFPWTSETRRLLCEIATEWRQYFKIRKPRKESMETFVESFMLNKIVPLWPQGWMRVETLLKYANPEPAAKKKQKKSRETTIINNNPSTTVTSNCSVRLEMTNANNVVTQERVKTPTNFVKGVTDNPVSYTSASQCIKNSSEVTIERKQSSIKHKDKIRDNTVASQDDNQSSTTSVAKISLVPTAQLLAQKPTKSHADKFNPMDLTSSSLLITPVNDYQKTNKSVDEVKQDIISITPYSESSGSINSDVTHITSRSHMVSSSGGAFMSASLKQRILQESVDPKSTDRRLDDRDCDTHTIEMKEKKRDRWPDDKYKSHDIKKRRKEHKTIEQSQQQILTKTVDASSTLIQTQSTILTREEQEQRQIEETMAATNFLSQMINDDAARMTTDNKRKETISMIDDGIGSVVQPSEQEKDVQMVMRSLKELQELQEMKYSPSHSPLQKPKASHQYAQSVGFTDDYHRHYHKKDEKLRLTKDESQW